jgi:hypothetical protein
MARLRVVLSAAVGLLLAATATASTPYPSHVEGELGMDCTPACTLCHATNGGGSGTVSAAFGQAAMAEGLTGGSDTDALTAALDALAASGSDVDGDGVGDIDALASGADPNGGDPFCGDGAAITPTYGCLDTGGRATSGAGLVALGLAIGAALRRRGSQSG